MTNKCKNEKYLYVNLQKWSELRTSSVRATLGWMAGVSAASRHCAQTGSIRALTLTHCGADPVMRRLPSALSLLTLENSFALGLHCGGANAAKSATTEKEHRNCPSLLMVSLFILIPRCLYCLAAVILIKGPHPGKMA